MPSRVWICFIILFLASYACAGKDMDKAQRKVGLLYTGFSPLATLLIIKFKKILLALLVLIGTAATTKFIAGFIHLLGYNCRRAPYHYYYQHRPSPVYAKPSTSIYGTPQHTYDNPYLKETDFHYYSDRLERALRGV